MSSTMVCLVLVLFSVLVLVLGGHSVSVEGPQQDAAFGDNYNITFGDVRVFDKGKKIHLTLDKSSGSGFQSKMTYGSGLFSMQIKLPCSENTAGVVTAFYLTSNSTAHDEIDFEFLGTLEGEQPILQTNIFVNGEGHREERVPLWFNPSQDFHSYKILWTNHSTAFFVDDIPIRVYANNPEKGVPYPTQAMRVIASLWNGEDWATHLGKSKVDWMYSPFTASFRGFSIDGCALNGTFPAPFACDSPQYWWNRQNNLPVDKWVAHYENIKREKVIYDYCKDRQLHPVPPPECRPDSKKASHPKKSIISHHP